MDALGRNYVDADSSSASSSGSDAEGHAQEAFISTHPSMLAPPVVPSKAVAATVVSGGGPLGYDQSTIQELAVVNPALSALLAPVQGPLPDEKNGGALVMGAKSTPAGYAKVDDAVEGVAFDVQFNSFQKSGIALAPNDPQKLVRADVNLATLGGRARGREEFTHEEKVASVAAAKAKRARKLERENRIHDPATKEYPVEDRRMGLPVPAAPRAGEKEEVVKESSEFHGSKLYDYQGRSFVDFPPGVETSINPGHVSFVPKRCIYTWRGHTKGVSTIKLFPQSGHLLLSASMDCTVKIWTVDEDRGKVMRTYAGHNKAVRDVCFSSDGRKFLSAAYDRSIKLWDTETGQFVSQFSNRAIPYCVKYNPDEDKQNEFLAGCSDKKIIQYDTRTAEVVQQYDQHMSAVNTIAFVDGNRRFVSSSDDKSLRVWEWGIPVVIKYVSEPEMHSMPAVTVHPNQKWLSYQSLDNQIVTYSARDKFKLNPKKTFKGHLVAGYACGISISPDGRFIGSGDSSGRLMFWDWKSTKLLRTLKAHQGVTIACEWHPTLPSKVVTCGWDGLIKYWD